MSALSEYIKKSVSRVPAGSDAKATNVVFFSVLANPDAEAETLRALIASHKGPFGDVDVFDGKDHSYIELGGWLGDQGTALDLIGLGTQLKLWTLLSPRTVFKDAMTDELEQQMAGSGYISLQASLARGCE